MDRLGEAVLLELLLIGAQTVQHPLVQIVNHHVGVVIADDELGPADLQLGGLDALLKPLGAEGLQ